jgi:pyrimidine deaminase RibD-like protein
MSPEELFELTLAKASECVAEGGIRPKVAAAAVQGEELLAVAFRGETGSGDHAEFVLLQKKNLDAPRFVGATIYTTLEPCTVRGPGKTACARRLADARVAKVVIGMIDPNPTIRGGGVEILRDAGVEVELYPAKYMARLEALNADFTRAQRALRVTLGSPVLDELAFGAQLHASGQYRQATGHLEAALVGTTRWLASALLNTDSSFDRMLAAAEFAIAHDGTHYDQFFTAGYAHVRLGHLAEAEKRLCEAVNILSMDRSEDVQRGLGFQERWLQALGLIYRITQELEKPDGAVANQYRLKLSYVRSLGGDPRPLGPWEYELGL